MNNLKTLWFLVAGSLLFLTGMFIPLHYKVIRDIFLVAGVLAVLVFYVKTLWKVIHNPVLGSQRKIFWLIVVVCVPVMGNLAYVIIQDTLSRKQVPHGLW